MNLPKLKKPGFLRNNVEEMEKEIQRIHDHLITLDPGTEEYKKVQEQYNDLLATQLKVEDVKTGRLKLIFWVIVSAAVPVGYEWVQSHTESPYRLKALDKVPKNPPN